MICVVFRSKKNCFFHCFFVVMVYCACTTIWRIKFKEKIGLVVGGNLYRVVSVEHGKGKLIEHHLVNVTDTGWIGESAYCFCSDIQYSADI